MLGRVLILVALLYCLSSTAAADSSLSLQAQRFPQPPVLAHAAVVMDATTGRVLLARNAHMHLAIASTTKVMTAVLALQHGKLNDRIKVPKSAFNFEWDATVMGLKPGETVTLRALLYGLMLPSGADAANTIAIHYAGSEKRWVQWMNAKAKQLGMNDTHYLTAHGLDEPGQYSSAYDLAKLGVYASKMPALMKIADTPSHLWNGHLLQNLNHVISWYPGADGIKPGFTDAAGICQLLDVHRDGMHLVAAILNTPDLVTDARDLLNYGLQDFTWAPTTLAGDGPERVLTGKDQSGSYVYFVGAGHYIRAPFWQSFAAAGQLAALGFPRTEPIRQGKQLVQYFQNGALTDTNGHVTRVPLGLTPIPTLPSPTPTATPSEHTTPSGLPILSLFQPKPTPTVAPATIAAPFRAYVKAHAAIGQPVQAPMWINHDLVQIFRYGALVRDAGKVWPLPIGDRMLQAEGAYPAHAFNVYPPNFAPQSVLQKIAWINQ